MSTLGVHAKLHEWLWLTQGVLGRLYFLILLFTPIKWGPVNHGPSQIILRLVGIFLLVVLNHRPGKNVALHLSQLIIHFL
jgi:hypothetical protein